MNASARVHADADAGAGGGTPVSENVRAGERQGIRHRRAAAADRSADACAARTHSQRSSYGEKINLLSSFYTHKILIVLRNNRFI